MKTHLVFCLLAATSILNACATSTVSAQQERGIAAFADDVRLGEEVNKICFNRNIDGFSNNTRDTVVLSAGPSKDYIVEVRGICPNLRYAQSIGIDTSQSCVTRGDYLVVSESAFPSGTSSAMSPDRCLIDKIYKWDKRAKETKDVDTETNTEG